MSVVYFIKSSISALIHARLADVDLAVSHFGNILKNLKSGTYC